jgi:hypothetical protein
VAGKCIFCNGASGTRLSKEHIFPDWLRQLFPRSPADSHTHGRTSWVGLEPFTVRTKKQGQAGSRRVKVVCQKCNNEWLSALEKRTQPLLMMLIEGTPFALDADSQRLLATWAAKTIMAAEFIHPEKVAVPAEDRASLMRNLAPPERGWWIWMAGSQGTEWLTGLNHFSARINVTPVDLETPDVVNLQSTTIGIGQLVIYAISTSVPGHDFALSDPNRSDLKPIWPQPTAAITWPRLRLLTNENINVINTNLPRAFERLELGRRGTP